MPRPREFDVDQAIDAGLEVFWTKGYEATSTEDLRKAMRIGRQSLYDTFGDKGGVYIYALKRYHEERVLALQEMLAAAPTPIAGLERVLLDVVEESDAKRQRGCLAVSSMCELGGDYDVRIVNETAQAKVLDALTATITRARELGEVAAAVEPDAAAAQLHATYVGMRVLGKGKAEVDLLRDIARSTIASLRRD